MIPQDLSSLKFPLSHLPMVILDFRGTPVKWNKAAENILAPTTEKDAVSSSNRSFKDLFLSLVNLNQILELQKILFDCPPFFTFDITFKKDDLDFRWIRLICDRLENKQYLAVLDDISHDKTREINLVQAKESAEKASSTRSQFLANISHEIRTPLQTILGMMDLLTETRLDEEQTEYARQVRFSAEVMLTLINDILDISKIEAGHMHIEEVSFNLTETIERSVDLITIEAGKKGLEVIIDIDPELPNVTVGDPHRLQQVILNLVKNAVKFTPQGEILVQVTKSTLKDEYYQWIRFEVIDSGIGVRKEAKSSLFTQFMQADTSTTRKFGGSGLGLAISRNIVELMHGSIGMTDNPQGGSIFWFELPFIDIGNIKTQAPLIHPETRFLLVDDNIHARALLTKMLASFGFNNCTSVSSGPEALECMNTASQNSQAFDIVFIDMVMPEMDGWRLAAEIHASQDKNKEKLFLMVPEGSFGGEAKMKLLEWFQGYLYKPIKRGELQKLLTEYFEPISELETIEEKDTPVSKILPEQNIALTQENLNLNILVVEDHPVNKKILASFLQKAGARIVTADDGEQAIKEIQNQTFDLVFMDIQMPIMNGYEASMWIRNNGFTMPIIACTASAQEDEKERCISYGMNDILPKPYKREDAIKIMVMYGRTSNKQEKMSAETKENADTKAANAELHTQEASPSLSDEHIFDPILFMDIMMNDAETAHVLIKEYLEQTEAHIGILHQDIKSNNFEAASKTAHLLKGSSLNITAEKLAASASTIEHAEKNLSQEEYLILFAQFEQNFILLKQKLEQEGFIT